MVWFGGVGWIEKRLNWEPFIVCMSMSVWGEWLKGIKNKIKKIM